MGGEGRGGEGRGGEGRGVEWRGGRQAGRQGGREGGREGEGELLLSSRSQYAQRWSRLNGQRPFAV